MFSRVEEVGSKELEEAMGEVQDTSQGSPGVCKAQDQDFCMAPAFSVLVQEPSLHLFFFFLNVKCAIPAYSYVVITKKVHCLEPVTIEDLALAVP